MVPTWKSSTLHKKGIFTVDLTVSVVFETECFVLVPTMETLCFPRRNRVFPSMKHSVSLAGTEMEHPHIQRFKCQYWCKYVKVSAFYVGLSPIM